MQTQDQDQAEKLVRSWGFSHVFTWTDGPNAHYPPHSHSTLTTHLILRGELVISYPGTDQDGIHADDTGGVEYFETEDGSVGSEDGLSKGKRKSKGRKWKYGVGGRIDVDKKRQHEVWVGKEGCTYVIGEK